MSVLQSVVFMAPHMRFHAPEVPDGEVLLTLVKGGFVLVAAIVVTVLALKGSTGSARIRANKAKHNRPTRSNTNELGSGDFATRAQIQKWLIRKDDTDTALPVKDLKGSDGIACKQGN